jgi:hypothetical protein
MEILLIREIIIGEFKNPTERLWYRTENKEFLGTDYFRILKSYP